MEVGDLVIRELEGLPDWQLKPAVEQFERLGHGIVLSKQMGGSNPVHPCVTVYYPKPGQIYEIAESLMKTIGK